MGIRKTKPPADIGEPKPPAKKARTSTKTKAKTPAAAVDPLEALEALVDHLAKEEEPILLFNGMTVKPGAFIATLDLLPVPAIRLDYDYALYDYGKYRGDSPDRLEWFEIYKRTKVGEQEVWNRSLSAIRHADVAIALWRRLKAGDERLQLQLEIDHDYRLRGESLIDDRITIASRKNITAVSGLYADRRLWVRRTFVDAAS